MRCATDALWQTQARPQWSQTGALSFARLSRVGLLAALAAATTNLALFVLGMNLLGVSFVLPNPWPWSPAAPLPAILVAVASAAPGIAAAIILVALAQVVRRPVWVFQVVAIVAALLSLGGPLSLPGSVELTTKLALSVMHLAAAVLIASILTLGVQERERAADRELVESGDSPSR